MDNFKKKVKNKEQMVSDTGVWTKVLGFSQVDTQSGIWLKIPNGDWCYYQPKDKSMIDMAFTACSDLQNNNVYVLIPDEGPASGLQVGSGVNE